jgi:hypothetical protein
MTFLAFTAFFDQMIGWKGLLHRAVFKCSHDPPKRLTNIVFRGLIIHAKE